MDSLMNLNPQFLVFCGVNQTKEFLEKEGSELAAEALEWIVDCDEAGDFDKIDGYIEFWAHRFDARNYID